VKDDSSSQGKLLILWNTESKEIPPRPDNPDLFDESDRRHWYDMEYAGWSVEKDPQPPSPGDGPEGKRVMCLVPGTHPYMNVYLEGVRNIADLEGMTVEVLAGNWDSHTQARQVDAAIAARPDLVILLPKNAGACTELYRRINEAGIPVIGSNLLPSNEAFRYFLCWTGPDDWGQGRLLAREFARYMNGTGGYGIISHVPGSSNYYSRGYSVLTELEEFAPSMECLEITSTDLNAEKTRRKVTQWIERFGSRLKGIVSADDNVVQAGILSALKAAGRNDIVCAAYGGSSIGLEYVKQGRLKAVAYQRGDVDGMLAMKAAADWFNGLAVPPIRYLPKHIVTGSDVDEFLSARRELPNVRADSLVSAILAHDVEGIRSFFSGILVKLRKTKILFMESFRGLSIQILTKLMSIIQENQLDEESILGNYEKLFKNLFMQKTVERTLEWLEDLSLRIDEALTGGKGRKRLIERIVEYVDKNYTSPLSLKVLGYQYGITAAYLGQLFKKQTGYTFTNYLNALRVRKAKKLFQYTALKANEIADEVGYNDPNYFYTVFKKYTGIYPSEYRKQTEEE
jgi:ABC-type sugar transport system substrate-binding protein/AraC-like DNA-binding protein